MADVESLRASAERRFAGALEDCQVAVGQLTLVVSRQHWLEVCAALRDEEPFQCEQLTDLCGLDYAAYGDVEWTLEESTSTGFSRGVIERTTGRGADVVGRYADAPRGTRFAVVCHLLSYRNNHRIRIRTFAPDDELPVVPSLIDVWPGANWFEREAFDLFGIVFDGHPDLRRLLTDYGFVGHPFRKDFPLIGQVEMRYDPEKGRVIYEPVSIEPRVLVPKVIRKGEQDLSPAAEKASKDG